MIFKRRWFKILSAVLALVFFVGYFTFSTLLFPPHEGRWAYDVASLIPRDVDFFAAKGELRKDFSEFPRLAVMDRVEQTAAWKVFAKSPEYGELEQEYAIEETLANLDAQLAQIPLGLDPVGIFGGRDLALAGRFRGGGAAADGAFADGAFADGAFADGASADWAVYGRMSAAGKLGLSLLAYPGVLGLEKQGLAVAEGEGVLQLSGGELTQPLWVGRVKDVGVVGTSGELVAAAVDLAVRRGEGSLLLSSDYNDDIELADRSEDRDELELIFDVRALLASLGHVGPLPDPNAERFLPAFLGRIFQVPACKKVAGMLGFEDGISLDLHGTFSSEIITDVQRRVYGAHGFGHDDVLKDIALLAPADCAAFVYLTGPIDVLLKEALASLEPAMYSNLQDAFRQTGRFNSLDELVDELGDALMNRLALIVRKNDYPREMQADPESGELVDVGPPNDGATVFAFALVAWHTNEEKLKQIQSALGDNPKIFGLEGRNGEAGYYFYRTRQNFLTREFWSRFIPGTGIVATASTADHFYVTNHNQMLDQLIDTRLAGGASNPRLADRLDFRAMVRSSIPDANLLVWLDPGEAEATLRAQARETAGLEAAQGIDWVRLRREEDQRVVAELFPGKSLTQLTEQERDQLDRTVDGVLQSSRNDLIAQAAPQLAATSERKITYVESIDAALLCLSLAQRDFRLCLRAKVPLD